jgi:hypothetical protein
MQNDYWVYGAGKLYHPGSMEDGEEKDQVNWSERYLGGTGCVGGNYLHWKNPGWDAMSYSVNPDPMTENNCEDYKMVNTVGKFIQSYATSAHKNKPFFVGCGVFRPHLPWNLPKEFWDKFNTDDLKLPAGYKEGDLDDMPGYTTTSAHKAVVENGKWKEAIHAYLAALALADYNVGVLLDALEKSPYKDNTIVCFMGDHGWQLGEKERWGKNTLLDAANRTTMIIYDPSAKGNGQKCSKVVSLQDFYPTLVEIAGLSPKTDMEGNSLAPLLENPKRDDWQTPIVMAYRNVNYIKTNEWRYVRDAKVNEQLLFDIKNDPYEFNNLRNDPKYKPVIERLNVQLDSMISIGNSLKSKLLSNYSFVPKKAVIPGRIEAEDYDEGGMNQTYFDVDNVNNGGKYRTADGVDIYITDDAQGSFHVGDMKQSEWWSYTVANSKAGKFDVNIRVKNAGNSPITLQLFNRTQQLGELTIPPSKGAWQTVTMKDVTLTSQDVAKLRFKVSAGNGLLLNWFEFESKHQANAAIKANVSHTYLAENEAKRGVLKLDLTASDPIANLQIFSDKGKQICQETVPGEQRLAYHIPSTLQKGTYLLRVVNDNNWSVEKFVVR